MSDPPSRPSVLLIPGGGSSVHGYFADVRAMLEETATLIEADAPGLDVDGGRRWQRLGGHADILADAVRAADTAPVIVVGHSLGGLVALRFALDHPDLTASMVLLDPSPLVPAALLPAPFLRTVGRARALRVPIVDRGARTARHMRAARPRALSLIRRLLWYLLLDGVPLAADACYRRLGLPAVVVSAAEHAPASSTRRTHEHLVSWLPNARLETWPDTTHPLHQQRPREIATIIGSLGAGEATQSGTAAPDHDAGGLE